MSTPMEFEARFKYKQIPDIILPIGLNCNRCWDSGYCWISFEGMPAWAYCRCLEGKTKHIDFQFKLPIYDYEMERLFTAKVFPCKAFIPSSFESMKIGMERKVRDFRADLRLSEKIWMTEKK